MSTDPLKELFEPAACAEAPFRQALREQTSRVVRRRRWQRRVVWAGTALLFFAAGMASMAWLQRAPSGEPSPKVAAPQDAPTPSKPRDVVTPVGLEWQAFGRPPQEKAADLLAAGHRYLAQERDYDSALRCYRQALDTDASLLEFSAEDDWLIMALKIDRRKER